MTKLIAIGIVLATFTSATLAAEQYWIVRQSTTSCIIVDEKPSSAVTTVDNETYGSRAEAERSMRTMKGCAPE
jgi:hypothetical protein